MRALIEREVVTPEPDEAACLRFYERNRQRFRSGDLYEAAHILSLKDLDFARRFFDIGEVKYWHITSIAGPHVRPLMPALVRLDRVLTRLPVVKLMAWIFTFELKSKK